MGKGKPHKKSVHESDSHSKQHSHGRGKGRGRGAIRGRGAHSYDQGRSNDNEELFEKRLLESNWARYDHVDDVSQEGNINLSADIEEEYDETKDFEYIKTHAGSASSHFQFQEEKIWQDELKMNLHDEFLDLDLQALADDLSFVDIIDKLQLSSLPDDCQYCVENLKSKPDVESSSSLTNDSVAEYSIDKKNSSSIPVWNYNGVEMYKTYLKSHSVSSIGRESTKNSSKRALKVATTLKNNSKDLTEPKKSINEFKQKNRFDDNAVLIDSITLHTSPPQPDITVVKKIPAESQQNSDSNVNNCDIGGNGIQSIEEDLLSDLLSSKDSSSFTEPLRNVDETPCSHTDELDLDMLLDKADVYGGESPAEVNVLTNKSENESAEELDDWLDSILD